MEEVRLETVGQYYSYIFSLRCCCYSSLCPLNLKNQRRNYVFCQKLSYSAFGMARLCEVIFTILNRKLRSNA